MGTNYDPAKITSALSKEREQESLEQAKLVGASITVGLKGNAVEIKETKKAR